MVLPLEEHMLEKWFLKLRTLYKKHRFERIVQKIHRLSREKKKKEEIAANNI